MKKQLKIFIVDKDSTTVTIVESYLRDLAFEFCLEKGDDLSSIKEKIDNEFLNIFIVDISENADSTIEHIENIEKEFKNCKFILTSYDFKTDYIVRFLRSSKKDFITKPIVKTGFLSIINEIISKLTSEQDYSGQGKIISVFSNKGGLGKTTLAVNLASELAQINKYEKVILVDMNMFLGDVTTFLDITPLKDINYVIEKADTEQNITDLTVQYSDSNMYVIADVPYGNYNKTITRKDIIKFFNILRKNFKYIVIDSSSAITERTTTLLELADLILLISEANLPTLHNCKRCLDFFEKINVNEKTEIVLNRYSPNDDCQKQDVEEVLQNQIFATIPNDWKTVTDSINKGFVIKDSNPFSDINYSFGKLADKIVGKLCR
jgi:pilus assembly protein CpaE